MKIIITEGQKEKLSNLLNESPDMIFKDRNYLMFWDDDAISFGFNDNDAFIGYNKILGKHLIGKDKSVDGIGRTHDFISTFTKVLNKFGIYDKKIEKNLNRSDFDYPGRLWLENKIISFYTKPPKEKYYFYIDKLNEVIKKVYNVDINLREYLLEVKQDTFVHPNEYVNSIVNNGQNFDINQIHTLPPDKKRNTPQMMAYRELQNKIDGERFEKTPQYLWNFWKTKNLSENNHKITKEQLTNFVKENDIEEMAYPSSFDMEKFKSIKSFKDRVIYCKTHLKRLAEGSSRMVFQIDNEKVLKLAKNKKGLAQNEAESDVGYNEGYFDCIGKVFDYDENYLFIEMELARKCSLSDFKRITDYDFNTFTLFIKNAEDHKYLKRLFSEEFLDDIYDNNTILSQVDDLIRNWDLPRNELCFIHQYGIVKRNGQEFVVVVDYGLTEEIFDKYYSKTHKY